MIQKRLILMLSIFILQLSACSSVSTHAKNVGHRCDGISQLEHMVVRCYFQENVKFLSRRVNMSVRGLTAGDWPFDYQFVYDVDLAANGKITKLTQVQDSKSRLLNKVISRSLNNVSELHAPSNPLFEKAGFDQLKIMVVPARTPIMGEKMEIEQGTMLIYLVENCSSRSDRC